MAKNNRFSPAGSRGGYDAMGARENDFIPRHPALEHALPPLTARVVAADVELNLQTTQTAEAVATQVGAVTPETHAA